MNLVDQKKDITFLTIWNWFLSKVSNSAFNGQGNVSDKLYNSWPNLYVHAFQNGWILFNYIAASKISYQLHCMVNTNLCIKWKKTFTDIMDQSKWIVWSPVLVWNIVWVQNMRACTPQTSIAVWTLVYLKTVKTWGHNVLFRVSIVLFTVKVIYFCSVFM